MSSIESQRPYISVYLLVLGADPADVAALQPFGSACPTSSDRLGSSGVPRDALAWHLEGFLAYSKGACFPLWRSMCSTGNHVASYIYIISYHWYIYNIISYHTYIYIYTVDIFIIRRTDLFIDLWRSGATLESMQLNVNFPRLLWVSHGASKLWLLQTVNIA